MLKKLLDRFQENKKTILILIVIMAVGIFLRTYKFHDWMRFSRDQARDARIITDAIRGQQPLPLMGPKAAGTSFLLGPAYYYFSYASGKILGDYPDKYAYPSLFFAILAIPLLYLFMREYFSRNISLMSAAIMSVSYFFVTTSRFSSNPHLVPFFLLLNLLALLKLMDEKNKKVALWSILAGISLGIGVQLHTVYLVVMPIVATLVFASLFIRKIPGTWKKMLLVISVALALNATQIISEIKTGGQNFKYFKAGFHEKSTKSDFSENILWVSVCQIRANYYFLTSLQDSDACKDILKTPSKKFTKNIPFYSGLSVAVLFSVIGYALLALAFKKEADVRKKNFLKLVILLNMAAFAIFLFVAKFLFVSYFVMLLPIPFVLLGIIFKSTIEKFGRTGKVCSVIVSVLLIASGLHKDYQAAKDYERGMGNGSDSTTLGDIEEISQYMLSHASGSDQLYFTGNNKIAGRFNPPIQYFVEEAGKTMILSWKVNDKMIEPGFPLFYIENSSKEIVPEKKVGGREVISGERFYRQVVILLNN